MKGCCCFSPSLNAQGQFVLENSCKAAQLLINLSSALAYAHMQMVTHSELRRESLLLGLDGEVRLWGFEDPMLLYSCRDRSLTGYEEDISELAITIIESAARDRWSRGKDPEIVLGNLNLSDSLKHLLLKMIHNSDEFTMQSVNAKACAAIYGPNQHV